MLLVISPAKTLDFSDITYPIQSQIHFPDATAELVEVMRTYSAENIGKLMDISEKLAVLNQARFLNFSTKYKTPQAKQAVFAFKGDVYQGLEAETLATPALEFAQKHLRILSGLYGVLRPMDLIQPYRLEMGTSLPTSKGKNLYDFWGDKLTDYLNETAQKMAQPCLINLASQEYFQALQPAKLKFPLLHLHFKEYRNGKLQVISFNAKKARGYMTRYVLQNQLINPAQLKDFQAEGYVFEEAISDEQNWVFVR